MQSRTAASESVDRVRRMCASIGDSRELRIAVVDQLRLAIGFDSYAWLMTDPQTWVGSSPLADVPCLPQLPTLIRLKYLTALNRWTALPSSGIDRLHAQTHGDLRRSLLWEELLQTFDVVDVASLAFIDRFGCWGFLDLWRSRPAEPFTTEDVAFLGQLVKPLTEGLRRCQATTFSSDSHEPSLTHADPAVLLLSGKLDVVAQTEQAEQYSTDAGATRRWTRAGPCWRVQRRGATARRRSRRRSSPAPRPSPHCRRNVAHSASSANRHPGRRNVRSTRNRCHHRARVTD